MKPNMPSAPPIQSTSINNCDDREQLQPIREDLRRSNSWNPFLEAPPSQSNFWNPFLGATSSLNNLISVCATKIFILNKN